MNRTPIEPACDTKPKTRIVGLLKTRARASAGAPTRCVQRVLKPEAKKNRNLSGTTMWKYPPTVDEQRILEHATSGQTSETDGGMGGIVDGAGIYMQRFDAAPQAEEQHQLSETERAYGGRAAFEKAKAEGRTKLNYNQWVQVRTPAFKAWFGDWEAAHILNGEPLAKLKTDEAPTGGFKDIAKWAAGIFTAQGSKAVRAGLGEVVLDQRAAQDSLAHGGANKYKKVAFAAVKDVIERGALVYESRTGDEDSFYFSAPVEIDGATNIETVLVHRDVNTQRMYLHSVTTKENLLNQRVSSADDLTSQRSGSIDSRGVAKILQDIIHGKGVSKVIDPDTGEPMVVYHGARGDFVELSDSNENKLTWVGGTIGFYFTSDRAASSQIMLT